MNASDRWSEISRIYHEALGLPAAERASFLGRACAGAPDLRHELESLLGCHSDAEPFIAAPAFDVMASALAAETADGVVPIEVTRIRDVFAAALERPTTERLQFLERACALLVAEAERMFPDARGQHPGTTRLGAAPAVCPACHLAMSETDRFCRGCGTPVSGVGPDDGGRFRAGTLFAGRFRIAGVIGRGGMGEVYRADDLELGQTVALKFIASVRSDSDARARLRNEVRLARQISHPNVCRVYDIGEARGNLYLSMEYVDGEDLVALLKRIGRLPIDKGIDIAHKIAGGLAAAHAKGVLHRDLKPRNVVALEAVTAGSDNVIAREQAEAAGKEQVLTALGAAASRLREKLGESLASVQKFDASLPRATTASIDALNAYALALVEGREIPRLEAIPHLRRAIEIDPTFAMAHAQLSLMYANTGQPDLAPAYSRKAFELRDTVSDRERYFISWRYYVDAEQNWERALELAQSWTASYPRDASAFNSLGNAFMTLGQFEQAGPAYREAIRLDPSFVPAYSNLVAVQMALARTDEGQATLQQAADRRLDYNGTRRMSYLVAFIKGDEETMGRALDSSVGVRATNAAYGWQAHGSAFYGRVAMAHEQFRRGIQLSQQGGFQEVAADLSLEDAEIHASFGQCEAARAEARAGLEIMRGQRVLAFTSRVLALCGPAGTAASASSELGKRFPGATLVTRVQIPMAEAMMALRRGDGARALDVLDALKPFEWAPTAVLWPAYLRGQAYLQLKDARAASAQFRSVLDNRGVAPQSHLYGLAFLGLARATAAYGDHDEARKAYESLLALWKDADPTLQPLKDARTELARIR